jgi:NADH dehydrogenase (ubiquinone) Fe-S protein 3
MYSSLFKKVQRYYVSYLSLIFKGMANKIILKNYDIEIKVPSKLLLFVLNFLKDHSQSQCKVLIDLTVYDTPSEINRFTLIYSLLSVRYNSRIHVLTKIFEGNFITSAQKLFKGIN